MVRTLYSAKSMRSSSASKSSAMNKFLGNERVAKTLNTGKERRQMYDALKQAADGRRVTDKTFAKALGILKQDNGSAISNKERNVLKKEILGSKASQYSKYINATSSTKSGDKKTNSLLDKITSRPELFQPISKITKKPSLYLPLKNYSQNPIGNNNQEGQNESSGGKTIYDVIRERNSKNVNKKAA